MELITTKQLAYLAKISHSTIYRYVKSDPAFPKRVRLPGGRVRWVKSEVHAWISERQDTH